MGGVMRRQRFTPAIRSRCRSRHRHASAGRCVAGALKEPVNRNVPAGEAADFRARTASLPRLAVRDADLSTLYRLGPKGYKQVTIAGRILRETLRKGELPDPRVMRPSTARILIESMKGQ
jgi:hypothetical protein